MQKKRWSSTTISPERGWRREVGRGSDGGRPATALPWGTHGKPKRNRKRGRKCTRKGFCEMLKKLWCNLGKKTDFEHPKENEEKEVKENEEKCGRRETREGLGRLHLNCPMVQERGTKKKRRYFFKEGSKGGTPRRPRKLYFHKILDWKSFGNLMELKKNFEHPRKEKDTTTKRGLKRVPLETGWKESFFFFKEENETEKHQIPSPDEKKKKTEVKRNRKKQHKKWQERTWKNEDWDGTRSVPGIPEWKWV